MKSVSESIRNLKSRLESRMYFQLQYAFLLNGEMKLGLDHVLSECVSHLEKALERHGTITRDDLLVAEMILSPFAEKAKSLTILCVAHAHIDMNWMWGFQETVAITLDTFRTVLDLMEEYPDFTFSQSQASVYRIVEEYQPSMIPLIRQRIREGRWETTASHWVEADKNMISEESQVRHLMNTRRYLQSLFQLSEESFSLDYEPDTFGHHQNLPELLGNAGVRYYYHCRGYDGHILYNWKAPSGTSILVFKEPHWYNSDITPDMALHAPKFCREHGLDKMLKVYGCGNHGGGPTRKDVEQLLEMSLWPVFPSIRMAGYRDFFQAAEKQRDRYPVVEGELNFIFTGCYTSQSRIKSGNKKCEARLFDSEACALYPLISLRKTPSSDQAEDWNKVLFNHFHDILPGSGTIETREYAMGRYQEVLASANTRTYESLYDLAGHIHTLPLAGKEDIRTSRSEGAGAGFNTKNLRVTAVERGAGKKRLYHVFNNLPFEVSRVVELTVWDWTGDSKRLSIRDSRGTLLPHQFLPGTGKDPLDSRYWQHTYFTLCVKISVPSMGYETLVLDEDPGDREQEYRQSDFRVDPNPCFTLDNGILQAKFSPEDMTVLSLIHLSTGTKLAGQFPAGVFRLIQEDPTRSMTSWIVGKYMLIQPISGVRIQSSHLVPHSLRQWITYSARFSRSNITVTVSLDQGSECLDYTVRCEWLETGGKEVGIPHLDFHFPLGYEAAAYRYDIPFGTIDRDAMYRNVPALNGCLAINRNGVSLSVISEDRYGFRGNDNAVSLSLLRSSFDPDPHPELGIHDMRFCVMAHQSGESLPFLHAIREYRNPPNIVSGRFRKGCLPLSDSILQVDCPTAYVSALKPSETLKNGLIIRLVETAGKESPVEIKVKSVIQEACITDVYENLLQKLPVKHNTIRLMTRPKGVTTLLISLSLED